MSEGCTNTARNTDEVIAHFRRHMLRAIEASGRTVEDVCTAAGIRPARLSGDEVPDVDDLASFARELGDEVLDGCLPA